MLPEEGGTSGTAWVGFATIALVLIGLGSCLGAIYAPGDQSIGNGLFAIAAALSFGQLLTAIVRR